MNFTIRPAFQQGLRPDGGLARPARHQRFMRSSLARHEAWLLIANNNYTTGKITKRNMSPPVFRSATILSLDRVGVTYTNGVAALQPSTLEFRRGEIAVLLGSSGAGKSTLLRTLNLLVAPTRGRVISPVGGALGSAAAIRAHRKRTAMIFQHHQLIGRLTALQNVLVGRMGRYGWARSLLPLPQVDLAAAYDCLARVGLAEKALDRVDSLSGGQMQRVGIARALAQEPELILADEPVASLDPTTAAGVLDLLKGICRSAGLSAVVSLHQLDYARQFADRVIGLAQGRIVFDGAPAAMSADHLHAIYGFAGMPTRRDDAARADQPIVYHTTTPLEAAL